VDRAEQSIAAWPIHGRGATLADRTRCVYDRMAGIYSASAVLFHSRAHRCALEVSGIRDGMDVLEVATGSGQMFRRLVRANSGGATLGVDLSTRMAAHTQRAASRRFPHARTLCQAVDARRLPFRDGAFDAVVCCYLLELLSAEDIAGTLGEFRRVLRDRGRLTLVLIGQSRPWFNGLYRIAGKVAPAFWGRQVERRVPEMVEAAPFEIVEDRMVRQAFYPSRVLGARK
jgi:ubiquinone/menaquinone biosynthesis C-methylase UbiE